MWGGHWLDERFGTEPLYFLIGAGLGLLAAFYHFYRMYKTMSGRQAMTLTRYAAIVLGVVAATPRRWPGPSWLAESRAAVLTGAGLAAANTARSPTCSPSGRRAGRTNVFMGAVLGGMVGRMGVMLLAVVVAAVLLGRCPRCRWPCRCSPTSSSSCVFELAVLHRRRRSGTARR